MKVGMVFPGYGSQFVGMGKELYDTSRIVQEYFEEAYNCLNINFVKLCFASSDTELSAVEHAYVALFLTSVSSAAVVRQEGIPIHEVLGFDVGHLSALCAAEGISLPDGLYFLQKYAAFYKDFLARVPVKAYTVQGITTAHLKKIIAGYQDQVHIAEYITSNLHLITGIAQDVEQCVIECQHAKGICKGASVDAGLRSPLMEEVMLALKPYFEKIDIKNTSVPFVLPSVQKVVTEAAKIKRVLNKCFESPVIWSKILKQLESWDMIVVAAPGTALQQHLQALFPQKCVIAVHTPADIQLVQQEYQKGTTQDIKEL